MKTDQIRCWSPISPETLPPLKQDPATCQLLHLSLPSQHARQRRRHRTVISQADPFQAHTAPHSTAPHSTAPHAAYYLATERSRLQPLPRSNTTPDPRSRPNSQLHPSGIFTRIFREPVSTTNASFADELFRADKLIRHLCDFAPPATGRANVVRQALAHLYPAPTLSVLTESDEFNPIPPLRDILPRARIGLVNPTPAFSAFEDFARSLLEYFFVPLLAEGGKTSAPPSHASPNFYTSRSRVPPDQAQTSSDHRISTRAQCMQRDNSRCVITGALDPGVYDKLRRSGATIPVGVMTARLDAAHIIPHALNGGKAGVMKEENMFVWQVLEMFDPGVRLTLEGDKIDNPRNALMLDCTLHLMFGQLKWWLEEVPV